MTATTSKTEDLIRLLLERFIHHPRSLMIEANEKPGVVFWTMQCHADDHSKLVGKQGTHFHALKLLLAELGTAANTQFVLKRFLEPEAAPRREKMPWKTPEAYDARPARDLLCQIVENLGIGQFVVEIVDAGGFPLQFNLIITVRSQDDFNSLTVPREDHAQPMTTVGAIGTLFRAYANQDGVKFNLEVKRA